MRKALIILALIAACVAANAQTKADYAALDTLAKADGLERGLARYKPFQGSPAYRTYTKATGTPGGLLVYYAKWHPATCEWTFHQIDDAIAKRADE